MHGEYYGILFPVPTLMPAVLRGPSYVLTLNLTLSRQIWIHECGCQKKLHRKIQGLVLHCLTNKQADNLTTWEISTTLHKVFHFPNCFNFHDTRNLKSNENTSWQWGLSPMPTSTCRPIFLGLYHKLALATANFPNLAVTRQSASIDISEVQFKTDFYWVWTIHRCFSWVFYVCNWWQLVDNQSSRVNVFNRRLSLTFYLQPALATVRCQKSNLVQP